MSLFYYLFMLREFTQLFAYHNKKALSIWLFHSVISLDLYALSVMQLNFVTDNRYCRVFRKNRR